MIRSGEFGTYIVRDYSEDLFSELAPYWRMLETGKDMTAFQSYDWYENICLQYRQERSKNFFRECRYVVIFQNERPIMIAPFEIHRVGIGYQQYGAPRGVYFIGRLGYTDYLNFIYSKFDANALKVIIKYVSERYHQSRFYLDRLLESSDSYCYLQESYLCVNRTECFSALIIPETFEEYRTALSKNTRQNIRTALNRARRNDIELTHRMVHDEDVSIKEKIIALNEQRLNKKNSNSYQQMSVPGRVYCWLAAIYRKLFSAQLDVVCKSRNTFCFLVEDGNRIVSFFWGIRNDYLGEYYVILAGVDREYEWYSPNISHLYLFIEEYLRDGQGPIKVLDFTRGGEGYKKTIGCIARPVTSVSFALKD